MNGFIKLKIAGEIFAYMNENAVLIFYSVFYIFPYFLMKVNKKLGVIISCCFFLLPFLFYKNYLELFSFFPILLWAILSFLYVASRYFKRDTICLRENYLKEIKDKKSLLKNELSFIKQENSEVAEIEKKLFITYSVSKILSEALNIKEVSHALLKYIQEYFNITSGVSFYIYDDIEKQDFEWLCGERIGFSVERLYKEKNLGNFLVENDRIYFLLKEKEKILGFLALPLTGKIENIKNLAENFLTEIYPAIKRLQLFNSIEILSQVDGLTGVYRRGAFEARLREEFSRAYAFKTSLGLLMVDIDHFKKINDTYGHQAGDIILKRIANILKESVYETDFVARYGGEEFAIIFPRAEFSGAMRKAEYLREKIENTEFNIGFEKIRVTISAGIAHYPRDASDILGLIKMADKALYQAKQAGRNKVIDIIESKE